MTIVWRLTNEGKPEIIEVQTGPHILIFSGFCYEYTTNKQFIFGRMIESFVVMSMRRPFILPLESVD